MSLKLSEKQTFLLLILVSEWLKCLDTEDPDYAEFCMVQAQMEERIKDIPSSKIFELMNEQDFGQSRNGMAFKKLKILWKNQLES